jgi:hypothetical protein
MRFCAGSVDSFTDTPALRAPEQQFHEKTNNSNNY